MINVKSIMQINDYLLNVLKKKSFFFVGTQTAQRSQTNSNECNNRC